MKDVVHLTGITSRFHPKRNEYNFTEAHRLVILMYLSCGPGVMINRDNYDANTSSKYIE